MDALKGLETKLNDVFVKNAPFQLPAGFKKWVAEYAWIFAIIGTVFGIFACLALLAAVGLFSVVAASVGAAGYILFAWLALLVLVVQVALSAMSISPLKAKQKRGWDLLFYSQLISIVYSVFNWLQYSTWASNILSLIWSLIVTVIALYFLFQVREGFTKTSA